MSSNARAYLILKNGGSVTLDRPLSFSFKKDRYSPVQSFEGEFQSDAPVTLVSSATVSIKGNNVLSGYIHSIKNTKTASGYVCKIVAKSQTSLLEENHIKPGLYTQVSLRSFYDEYIKIANIPFTGGTEVLNYVNFSDFATMWDAVVFFCLKQYGVYPYVLTNNRLMFSLPEVTSKLAISAERIIEASEDYDTSRLISHIYMKDKEGNYATYHKACEYAINLGITREKHIPILYSWLHDVDGGLDYKLNFARRKCRSLHISYLGYFSEDIYTELTIPSGILGNANVYTVHGMEIKGDDKKVITTLYYYDDYYSNIGG